VDPDVNDTLTFDTVDLTSEQGAAVSIIGGQIVYDPTAVAPLNALAAGQRITDRFSYAAFDSQGVAGLATVEISVQSPLNVDPAPVADAITITEDGEFTDPAQLLENDLDPDQLPADPALQAVAETVTSTLGASVTIGADGSFVYDALEVTAVQALGVNQVVEDSFDYQVIDSQGGTALATVTLTVTGLNDAPELGADEYSNIDAGSLLVVSPVEGLLVNDRDVDTGDSIVIDLTASDMESAAGVPILLRPDGSFEYDPTGVLAFLKEDELFDDSFRYTIVDNFGESVTGTVQLQIIGVNDLPVAGLDGVEREYWTVGTQRLVVPAENGLLINDTDVDLAEGEQLEAIFVGTSQYGATVTVNPDGSFVYDPTASATIQAFREAGIDVIDTFEYRVVDGSGSPPLPAAAALPDGTAPAAAPADPTSAIVEIILRSGPSAYNFDVVSAGEFDSYGRGPSINNYGHVAFQANSGGIDSIYIWDGETGALSLVPAGLIGGGSISLPPRGDGTAVPMARFSEAVQINDDDFVIAQRQMNAAGILGILPMGLPILTFVDFALTYVEQWNGGRTLQSEFGLPRQVAVGDMGLAAAGIRWGNPLFLDMQFLALTALLPGAIGAAISTPFTLQPRAWVLNPTWSSVYFSPVLSPWLLR
jgi:VCBS repeat-containing protein